jgi:hypothetical protein
VSADAVRLHGRRVVGIHEDHDLCGSAFCAAQTEQGEAEEAR